jgi:tRNA G18 (ribose-2'-O)-methylase SpoU
MPNVFLHAPQDFHNLCLIARTLEALGHRECYVHDPEKLVRDRYGKARTRELRAVSAGAFEKIRWVRVENPRELISDHQGRAVATVLDPTATSLASYRFSPTDLLVFGSESRGLPADIVSVCGGIVTIPALGQTQSLNLAVAIGIVLFEWQRQG